MKVVILGAGNMFTNLIAGCLDAGCDIVGVFRHDKVRYPLIDRILIDTFNPTKEFNYIKSLKLYEIKAKSANSAEFKKEILRLNADVVFVGTWSEKLKKSIIDLPKIATINVHPSLLPKYRGPNPYLQAIKHMEQESGATFHLMDENLDTGAILLQKKIKIDSTDTGIELRQKIVLAAREGACELIKKLDEEIIIPVAQDESKASYFSHISDEDVMLDFSRSAEEISAHIRSFHPWSKCYFQHGKQFFIPNPYKLEILEVKCELQSAKDEEKSLDSSHVSRLTSHPIIVDKSSKDCSLTALCGDGKLLKMSGVKLYGLFQFFTALYIKFMRIAK